MTLHALNRIRTSSRGGLANRQEQLRWNNMVWYGSEAGTCGPTAIANYGKETSRGSLRGNLAGTTSRQSRFSAIFRFEDRSTHLRAGARQRPGPVYLRETDT